MAVYEYSTLQSVRRNIGDRAEPYTWSDEDLADFLDRASGNVNGASAYTLQAWAAEEARSWSSVNAGGLTRSKSNAAEELLKLAERYAAQSNGTAVLDQSKRPAFGRARVDWNEQDTEMDSTLPVVVNSVARRIRSETIEGS